MKEVLQDNTELQHKIRVAEKEAKEAKKKREIKTTAGFAVFYFLCFWLMEGNPSGIYELVSMVLVSIFLSFIHFTVNDVIYSHLYEANKKDREWIDILKKELDDDNP